MKPKISNIDDIRNIALDALSDFRDNKITSSELAANSKMIDTILDTVKSEIYYHNRLGQSVEIPFMESKTSHKILPGQARKLELEKD